MQVKHKKILTESLVLGLCLIAFYILWFEATPIGSQTQPYEDKLQAIVDTSHQTLQHHPVAQTGLSYQAISFKQQQDQWVVAVQFTSNRQGLLPTACQTALEHLKHKSILTHMLRNIPHKIQKNIHFTADIMQAQQQKTHSCSISSSPI